MFNELLKKDYIILDGGMGTMLQRAGLKLGEIPELFNITESEVVTSIHKMYVDAGSNIIYANTFGANRFKFEKTQYSVSDIVKAAISNARVAVKGTDCLVALDIGPIGRMLKPVGDLDFDVAYDVFKEIVLAGKEADVVVIETMTNLAEMKAALLAVKENSDLPVICTMSLEKNGRTFTGCTIPSMAYTLTGLGADAIGFNCSLGPVELIPFIEELGKYTNLPLVLKPNAGLPDPETNEYNISAEEFADVMSKINNYGVKFFGGCCGTTPEFICALKKKFADTDFVHPDRKNIPVAVCSQTKVVFADEPRIIGERINPTGKKLFKEALLNHNIDYILKQALEQTDAGADILDVNVGLPGIDEKEMMITVMEEIQGILDIPLQIDSTNPEVVENALRRYDGIPILNSVNGEDDSLKALLPIVSKYGAMVVGLTLDEDGVPKTVEKRVEIADKIIKTAEAYGISRDKIIIDCLTLTASAEQENVLKTLEAIKIIKEKYGVKTVLGVSNISFGLPNRELINRTFFTMALLSGLDFAIINPNNLAMMESVKAYKVLADIDKNSIDYIEFSENNKIETDKRTANTNIDFSEYSNESRREALVDSICKGLKEQSQTLIKLLLKDNEPMDIINNVLIPALDKTGTLFETGKIFLPQLILSANAAGICFDEIKVLMTSENSEDVNKGTVVICTVKGDIHDIGKNIVKVLLENYGYKVIDLGKDVPAEKVVEAAKKYNAGAVALSALMTTTLCSMEETIKLVKENKLDCKIMVGGAVLTEDYAMKIGADYYAKDAKRAVDVAKLIFD
ncbi:MAG: homocysteine methyltransferase [Lachnospiraceae bacterium]|nr:homocysteine methyltransferase [Lachnospiraceae bacterium]